MQASHRLLSTLVIAIICAVSPQIASASASTSSHHKNSRLCKSARRHHRHRKGCAVSSKKKVKHTRAAATSRQASSALINLSGSTAPAAPKVATPKATAPTAAPVPSESIAEVLATSCQNTGLIPTSENLQLIREATLCLVNQERARNDESPLTVNERLEQDAQSYSERLVSEDYFSHTAPNGETPLQRVEQTGYIPADNTFYTVGENLAWATLSDATPQAIVEAWIASPDHLENILESRYRETALGIDPAVPASLSGGDAGATYAQEFGLVEQ